MTYKGQLIRGTIIVGIITFSLTALSSLIYGSVIFYKWAWAWIRFSILMTTLTCLWTYTFWFFHVTEYGFFHPSERASLFIDLDRKTTSCVYIVIFIIPIEILILHPRIETPEIFLYNPLFYYVFVVLLLLQIGAFIGINASIEIYREQVDAEFRRKRKHIKK